MARVIQMSNRELTRLRVMIDLADDRLTLDAAASLMGLGRRQIYRLCRAFSADGPAALASRKRGRPSNRKRGETFRATVLSLVREQYIDFGPTLAAEKLMARHGLRIGVETLRARHLRPPSSQKVTYCQLVCRVAPRRWIGHP